MEFDWQHRILLYSIEPYHQLNLDIFAEYLDLEPHLLYITETVPVVWLQLLSSTEFSKFTAPTGRRDGDQLK